MEKEKVLTIVDVQNDFVEGGSLGVDGGKQIVPVINKLIESGEYSSIIATQDFHPIDHISFAKTHGKEVGDIIKINYENNESKEMILWPRHCVARTFGAELVADLIKQDEYVYVQKGTDKNDEGYSGFSYLHKELIDKAKKNKTTLVLDFVGIATDYCVFQTAKDTADYVKEISADVLVSVNVLLYATAAINSEGVYDLYKTVPFIQLREKQ